MPLRPKLSLEKAIADGLAKGGSLAWLPRDQGTEGSCAGQALAALVDIQRYLQDPQVKPVSARMLYQMARLQDDAGSAEGTTLRAVVKGLYHNGVCAEELWPYDAGKDNGALDVARAKDARAVPLGAYYRLAPNLGDYHAALNECGAVLASASLHSGWSRAAVAKDQGRIVQTAEDAGGHAFVIVGYDDKGFLILNSWGGGWGGFDGMRGVAHWNYQDWADSIMDGWVLRLGVSAPGAFHLTLGEQGLFFMQGGSQPVTTPGHDVLGHMAHLDDGRPVGKAPYSFSMRSFDETARYLARRPGEAKLPVARAWNAKAAPAKRGYHGMILRFGGSVLGLKDMAAQVAREKPLAKERGLYPYTIAWCNDFVEHTEPVLNSIFEEAFKQIGREGDQLDDLIEERVHGIGRAFWRDIKRAAHRSARVGRPQRDDADVGEEVLRKPEPVVDERSVGPVVHMVRQLMEAEDLALHFIADGAGIMLLRKVFSAFDRLEARDQLLGRIATLDLITPTIDREVFEDKFRDVVKALSDRAAQKSKRPRCALHVPSTAAERRLAVGRYSRSMLDLVEKGFSEPDARPDFIGKSFARTRLRRHWNDDAVFGSIELIDIDVPDGIVGPLSQSDLQSRAPVFKTILDRIAPI